MGKRQVSGYISKAQLSNVKISPRRARLVADLVRGLKVGDAVEALESSDKKTAPCVKKLLLSAVANASNQGDVNVDDLVITKILVDGGQVLKRFMPRAHGKATAIRKRHSTITIELDTV
jgi:large subunit ribosomal protein L22